MGHLHSQRWVRYTAVIITITVSVAAGFQWRHMYRVQQARLECTQLESQKRWSKLLVAAREWQRLEPGQRDPLRAGATAGKELHQAPSAFEFLRDYPGDSQADIPWLTMRADLQFGPIRKPADGARTCQEILRLDPGNIAIRQRLIFFYAVTAQPVQMLQTAYAATEAPQDSPEFYVYAFLSDGIRLTNAIERIQYWLNGEHHDELLMVAYALNTARNLDGGIPNLDESLADALRRAQQQRTQFLQKLRGMFPDNHQLLAYDLGQGVEAGQTIAVANALSRATVIADSDYRFWRARGWLFLKAGDYQEAEAAFAESIRLHPLDWRSRHYLAETARRSHRLAEAEAVSRLAAEGKQLETDLLATPDMRAIESGLLIRLAEFSDKCGADRVAARLKSLVSSQNASGAATTNRTPTQNSTLPAVVSPDANLK